MSRIRIACIPIFATDRKNCHFNPGCALPIAARAARGRLGVQNLHLGPKKLHDTADTAERPVDAGAKPRADYQVALVLSPIRSGRVAGGGVDAAVGQRTGQLLSLGAAQPAGADSTSAASNSRYTRVAKMSLTMK